MKRKKLMKKNVYYKNKRERKKRKKVIRKKNEKGTPPKKNSSHYQKKLKRVLKPLKNIIKTLRADFAIIFDRDPAARNWLEVLLCFCALW